MSKALSKHRNLIKEFVVAHRMSYFWFDHYQEDEFKTALTKYSQKVIPVKPPQDTLDWYDSNGVFSFEKFAKSVLPEKKELESVLMEDFNKKFAGTNVKFEDCVKFAEEQYAQQLEFLKAHAV